MTTARKGTRVRLGYWTGTVFTCTNGSAVVDWDERLGADLSWTEYRMTHLLTELHPE